MCACSYERPYGKIHVPPISVHIKPKSLPLTLYLDRHEGGEQLLLTKQSIFLSDMYKIETSLKYFDDNEKTSMRIYFTNF